MTRTSVWVDTDLAVGIEERDVDDGLALLAALRSPELQVVGISAVFGNGDLPDVHRLTLELLERAGAGLDVHRGAATSTQLGEGTEATRALDAALDEVDDLVVLALGPLTTVATVLQERFRRRKPLPRVVAVAGRRPGQLFQVGNGAPMGDFNLECDPAAMAALLSTTAPVTLAGFEVASHVWLRREHLAALSDGPPAARWLAEPSLRWLELWERRFGVEGFHPFDTLAVAAVARPELVRTEVSTARVTILDAEEGETWRGEPRAPVALQVTPHADGGRTVDYARSPAPGFVDDLMSRLLTQ
jgi:pyrimidine-specific ribonucleoside hydrolase